MLRAECEFLVYLACINNIGETRNCVSARENSARENNWRNAC